MIEGHRLHETQVEGRGARGAGPFSVEAVAGPDGIAVLVLAGELDIAAAPVAREHVDGAAGARGLVLDLSRATFVDSSMLKELLRAAGELARYDTRLVLAGIPPAVQRLLDLMRTAPLFTIAQDREAGLRLLDV